jgi:hypothetical protein
MITFSPHMSSPRQIVEGQLIHESAFECGDYTPKAVFPPGSDYQWNLAQLRQTGKIEDDPYASIRAIMERLKDQTALSPLQLNRLGALRLSGEYRNFTCTPLCTLDSSTDLHSDRNRASKHNDSSGIFGCFIQCSRTRICQGGAGLEASDEHRTGIGRFHLPPARCRAAQGVLSPKAVVHHGA